MPVPAGTIRSFAAGIVLSSLCLPCGSPGAQAAQPRIDGPAGLHQRRPAPRKAAGAQPAPQASARVLQDRIDRVADALVVQSDRYWHRGDYPSVAFCQRAIVELDPTDVVTWGDLGWLEWAGLNDEAAAEKTLRAGLAANPHRYEMYDELGNYLMRRKRYPEAAAMLTKAVSFKNSPDSTWNSYAHALERMGRPVRAAHVWEAMKARFPGNPHSDVNLARMRRKGLIPPKAAGPSLSLLPR